MCPVKKCFIYEGNKPFTGAHRFIRDNYFPFEGAKELLLRKNSGKRHNHRYKRDVMSKKKRLQHGNVLLGGPLKNQKASGASGFCYFMDPKSHGSIVDKELATYASLESRLSRENFVRRGRACLDPCTVHVIGWLNRHKMIIRECQRIIYDERESLATAVDMICVKEKTGELVVVELKTTNHSSSDWYEKPLEGYRFKENFGRYPFSFFWIDQLQLFIMVSILRKCYRIPVRNENAFVLRVGPDRIWRYNLKI